MQHEFCLTTNSRKADGFTILEVSIVIEILNSKLQKFGRISCVFAARLVYLFNDLKALVCWLHFRWKTFLNLTTMQQQNLNTRNVTDSIKTNEQTT